MKDYDKTVAYLKEYDAIPAPTDPQAQIAARLPAALFYWLAETARKAGQLGRGGDLLCARDAASRPGRSARGRVVATRRSAEPPQGMARRRGQLRKISPAQAGREGRDARCCSPWAARNSARKNFDAAKKLGEQALLQEPEGPRSAAARMLLGETAFAAQNYPEAARMFATLAVLFDDPKITPQAISRAADAFEKAGDAKSAADWRQKLKDKYPQYQPSPYL